MPGMIVAGLPGLANVIQDNHFLVTALVGSTEYYPGRQVILLLMMYIPGTIICFGVPRTTEKLQVMMFTSMRAALITLVITLELFCEVSCCFLHVFGQLCPR